MAGGALSFREDPFRLMPDRRFIFSTEGFRRAFDDVLAGVRERRGMSLLTGASGTGKTTLLQALQEEMQANGAIVFLRFHPDLSGADLIASCMTELGSSDIPTGEPARIAAFRELVQIGTQAGGPPAVLVIDEAGQFSDTQLLDLCRLLKAETPLGDVLQVVLAALPSFEERLQQPDLAPLQQAILHRARLQPLRQDELAGYIAHRCSVAGHADAELFEAAAVDRVYEHTRGTPRLVNRVCSAALFAAARTGQSRISVAVVEEAAEICATTMPGPTAEKAEKPPRAMVAPEAAPAPVRVTPPIAAAAPATPAIVAAAVPPPAPKPASSAPQAREIRPALPTPDIRSETQTLVEAERAWAGSRSAAARPAAPPRPAANQPQRGRAPARPLDDAAPANPPAVTTRRRFPVPLAASIALLLASGGTVGALYWPSAGRDEARPPETGAAVASTLVALPPTDNATTVASAAVASAAAPAPLPDPPVVPTPKIAESVAPDVSRAVTAVAPVPPPPAAETVVATSEPPPAATLAPPERPSAPPEAANRTIENATAASPAAAQLAAAGIEPPVAPPQAAAAAHAETSRPPDSAAMPEPTPPAAEERVVEAQSIQTENAAASDPRPVKPADAAASVEPAAGLDEKPAEPVLAMKIVPETPLAAANPVAAQPPERRQSAAVPTDAPRMTSAEPARPPTTVAQSAPLDAATQAELQQLMARGDEMMRIGDPASARLFYERAAGRGLARAFTAVGRTYDPTVLMQLKIRGGGANGDRALEWYRRGSEAGDSEAGRVASELTAWLARPR